MIRNSVAETRRRRVVDLAMLTCVYPQGLDLHGKATIVRWLKCESVQVAKTNSCFEMETDKAGGARAH
jgi:hypothetical protein